MRKIAVKATAFMVAAVGVSAIAVPAIAEAWKTPQVTGSAPVKEEPKSNEARAPIPVGTNPYAAHPAPAPVDKKAEPEKK